MLEQYGSEPASLVIVTYDEGNLGLFHWDLQALRRGPRALARRGRGATVVAGDCDEPTVDYGHERKAVLVVDVYIVRDLLVTDAPSRGEEPEVHRLARQLCSK